MSDIDALFNLADADGNGELSGEEFSDFIASLAGVYPGGGMSFSAAELSEAPVQTFFFSAVRCAAHFRAVLRDSMTMDRYGVLNPSGNDKVMCSEFRHFVLASVEHHQFHDDLAATQKDNRRGYDDMVVSSHTIEQCSVPGDPPAGWTAPGVEESKSTSRAGDRATKGGGGGCVLS